MDVFVFRVDEDPSLVRNQTLTSSITPFFPSHQHFFAIKNKIHALPVMAHGYSLRSNTKGRRRHKSADETNDQVSPEGDSGIVDPRATGTNSESDTPETAHHSPAPAQDSEDQTTEDLELPETGEDIQAAREREEAVRIQGELAARRYEEELYWLRVQTEVIRQECEARAESATRKWEVKRKIRRGGTAVVFDEPSLPLLGVGSPMDSFRGEEDERGEVEMAVDRDDATQQLQPQQPHVGPPGPFPLSGMGVGMGMVGPSHLETTEKDGDDDDDDQRGPGEAHTGTSAGSGQNTMNFPTPKDHSNRETRSSRPHHPLAHPQSSQRQPVQLLMGIPHTDASSSHDMDTD